VSHGPSLPQDGRLPRTGCVDVARLTAGFDRFDRLDLATHLAVHGELPRLGATDLVALAEEVKLRGRGGAGFPFARKLSAVSESVQRRRVQPVIVVNATEGEPAAWKDKVLLARAPHLILDGATLAATALRAEEVVIGVADEGPRGAMSLRRAIAERSTAFPMRVVLMPARFISGEGGALVRGIDGALPIPPGRKVLASDMGVKGAPTLLSNAETFAQLATAARLGPRGYAAVGEADEPGTVMLSVFGAAASPAVLEVPTGTPLEEVLSLCQSPPGPVLLGGYHGGFAGAAAAGVARVSRNGFSEAGGALGAGIVLPLGDVTCPVGEADRVLRYLARESAGQCGPCRLGLPDLARVLGAVADGSATPEAVRAAAAAVRGRGACSHPDGAGRFALSAVTAFHDDIAVHRRRGGCGRPVLGVLPLPGAAGPTLSVDWARCDGHGLCAHVAPELIQLDANGFPTLPSGALPDWLLTPAKRAVRMCPALALRMSSG
jgi:NADH:ubiquinone oxidoreductase subunit F (NADH-binding)/ferredoxin